MISNIWKINYGAPSRLQLLEVLAWGQWYASLEVVVLLYFAYSAFPLCIFKRFLFLIPTKIDMDRLVIQINLAKMLLRYSCRHSQGSIWLIFCSWFRQKLSITTSYSIWRQEIESWACIIWFFGEIFLTNCVCPQQSSFISKFKSIFVNFKFKIEI